MVASLSTLVATHDAKIDGLGDDVRGLRELHREMLVEMRATLATYNAECEKKIVRVEAKIDKQDAERGLSQGQKASIIIAAIAGNATIIAALIGVLQP